MLENVQGFNIIEMSQAAELQTTEHTAALQRALVTMLQLPLLCNVLHTFYYPLWQSSQKLCNFHICVILHRRTENQRQQKVFNTAFHVPSPQASSKALHAFYGGFDIFYINNVWVPGLSVVRRQKCLFWLNNSDNSFNDTRRCWEKQWVAENGRNPWCCAIGGWWQIP